MSVCTALPGHNLCFSLVLTVGCFAPFLNLKVEFQVSACQGREGTAVLGGSKDDVPRKNLW